MNTWKLTSLVQDALQVAPEKQNIGTKERVWSTAIGAFLATFALRRFGKGGLGLLLPAGYLLYRGSSGYCPASEVLGRDTSGKTSAFRLRKTVMINRPPNEVYQVWRDLVKLPDRLKHIKKVDRIDDKTYRWTAEFGGQELSWTAIIVEDNKDKKISWRSVEPTEVENYGYVEFAPVPGMKATKLDFNIVYRPAGTELGNVIAGVLTPVFKQKVREDLQRFKSFMEVKEPEEIYQF